MKKYEISSAGRWFIDLLMIFIVLKLCGLIDWSWMEVLIPLWGALIWSLAFGGAKEVKRKKETKDLIDKAINDIEELINDELD